jgi:integrase
MRGEGRVFQLKRRDGSLRSSRWWIAYSVNGREVRESAGKSEEEARKTLKKKLKEIAGDRWIAPEQARMTVAELLEAYERDLEAREAKDLDSIRCRLHALRDWSAEDGGLRLGDRRAASLGIEDFEKLREERLAAKKSKQTIDHAIATLRAAYRLAQKQGRLSRVPPCFPMYHAKNVRRGFIEPEQAEAIARRLTEPFAALVRFARASTWRRDEVESLTWDQVDRRAREVRLHDSKNGRGRVLPLDDFLLALIEQMWARREFKIRGGSALSAFVFHRKGRPVGDWRKRWRKACVEEGLGRWIKDEAGKVIGYKGAIFHDLRRSGIRDLVRAGVPQSVVMAISGHRTIATFLRYDIASEEDKRMALESARVYREARGGKGNVVAMDRGERA